MQNTISALDEGYSNNNYVRKFLRALHPKWRAKVTAIEESKDLTSLSLDELIGNLKVHEMIINKDSEIVKAKVERKSIALKAKKESSDEECSTFGSEDEEYAMAVETLRSSLKEEVDSCDDPNHLIGECPKLPKDKNQRAFVRGSWSDSGEEDDEKVKDETCLVAHASNEVCFESSYFSDENSSIDDLALDNEYDKLCKMSLKIITKNKKLKATRNSLENKLKELKDKLSILKKNKGVDLDCAKCHALKIKNEKLKEESTRLNKFENSTHCLNEMLSNQKSSGDKLSLGFNSFEASSSGTKEIKFVKAHKKTSSDGGPINMGGPQSVQAAPKIIMGLPPATPGSEKNVSFQKSNLGPRPKHIIICIGVNLEPDEWIKDSECSKHTMGNRKLFSTYKAYNRGNVIFGSNLRGNIIGKGYFQNSKAYIVLNKHIKKVEESLNVTFNETPPPSKTSPLVDDDLDEEEAIKVVEKKNLENDIMDETLEIDEIVNIKKSRNHPLENVIINLNQRTLRWSLDELVYGAPSKGPYQTNLPSPNDIISFIREDQEGQVTRIRHQEEVESENLERIVAREKVVIPLPPPPLMNHLYLISTMMMMMMEIMKGPRVQVLLHPFVKESKEKDKIGSKPDKNGKRGEAGKILKQLQGAKVTAIEESKDFTSLSLNELIRNLKVHEMIIKKDFKIVKAKGERRSITLKAKKESSGDECSTSESEDEEYAMA
nr:hypothetical protein [Tanacetum cinerariifolium]